MVEMVLQRGSRFFKDKLLHLDKWILEAGCFREVVIPKKYG